MNQELSLKTPVKQRAISLKQEMEELPVVIHPEEFLAGEVIQGQEPVYYLFPDMKRWLTLGPATLRGRIKEQLYVCSGERRELYECVLLVLDGAITYMSRCAKNADRMSVDLPEYEETLRSTAHVCRDLTGRAAQTYWEALQSALFLMILLQNENRSGRFLIGRVDRLLNHYYLEDLRQGTLNEEVAKELTLEFVRKCGPIVPEEAGENETELTEVFRKVQKELGVSPDDTIMEYYESGIMHGRLTTPLFDYQKMNASLWDETRTFGNAEELKDYTLSLIREWAVHIGKKIVDVCASSPLLSSVTEGTLEGGTDISLEMKATILSDLQFAGEEVFLSKVQQILSELNAGEEDLSEQFRREAIETLNQYVLPALDHDEEESLG